MRYGGRAGMGGQAVTDAEYIEVIRSEDHDALMAHCKRVPAG